jgi:hypothetical protein
MTAAEPLAGRSKTPSHVTANPFAMRRISPSIRPGDAYVHDMDD